LQIPLTLTATHLELDRSVEELIRRRVARLERYYQPIVHCQVFLDGPGSHHLTGGPYEVRVVVRVPGRELAVARQRSTDLSIAVREAFDAARRQLEDFARRQRGDVKAHVPQPRGRVIRLFPAEGYGFVLAEDGREIYFHRHSVLAPGFEHLAVGTEVRFAEEEGAKGPQASTVEIAEEAPAEAALTTASP
jgi:cold shock CspA family protein/ribosome-associated translation inhibitor RaiA